LKLSEKGKKGGKRKSDKVKNESIKKEEIAKKTWKTRKNGGKIDDALDE